VFAINADGTGFTNLHSFTGSGSPYAGLILSSNTLYGTTFQGGDFGAGMVFKVNTDGTGFTNLHSFAGIPSDGMNPVATLILSGDILYGTGLSGGSSGNGTVFAVNTDGTSYTNLYIFTAAFPNSLGSYTNRDGAHPQAASGLILSGNTLFGTANIGGRSGNGTIFSLKNDGTGFTTQYGFTATPGSPPLTNSDGANPVAGLIKSGNTLYGTTRDGGNSGNGTVFSLLLPPPQLTIILSEPNVILTWPTNAAGFTLQSTTNLGSSAGWTTNLPPPVVVNGLNTVTSPVSGTQQFFRLSQ
jgi:uncharacterized repeat protein (TIGR03803 family)